MHNKILNNTFLKISGIFLGVSFVFIGMGSFANAQEVTEPTFESSVDVSKGIPTRPPEPSPPGFTIAVYASNLGAEINNAILDIEIHSESGEKVEQWFFENHDFERDIDQMVFWVPELPEEAGKYKIHIGIFSKNWANLLHWHDSAAIIIQNQDGTRSIEHENHETNNEDPEDEIQPDPGDETQQPGDVSIWWPTDGATVSGTQPFKALLEDRSLDQYEMFWQVDGGQWNAMYNSHMDWPHKEAMVDLSSWNWNDEGHYTVNFIATEGENILTERKVEINKEPENQTGTVGDITICGRPGTRSFNACYYQGQNFETFKVQRDDGPQLNFDWGADSPNAVLQPDNFSAQYRGLFDFEAGMYEFTVTADDGVRLFVDTEEIVSEWHDQPATTYVVQKEMEAGSLRGVIVHYYENDGDAVLKVSWRKIEDL